MNPRMGISTLFAIETNPSRARYRVDKLAEPEFIADHFVVDGCESMAWKSLCLNNFGSIYS